MTQTRPVLCVQLDSHTKRAIIDHNMTEGQLLNNATRVQLAFRNVHFLYDIIVEFCDFHAMAKHDQKSSIMAQ